MEGYVLPTQMKAYLRTKDIRVSWQPPLHTKRGVMMYRVEWREKLKPAAETNKAQTKSHTYTIRHLRPNTEYDVRILAYVPGTLPPEPGEEKKTEGYLKDIHCLFFFDVILFRRFKSPFETNACYFYRYM